MPQENNDESAANENKKEEITGSVKDSDITFCWHCGADIKYQSQREYCANCHAPLSEEIRSEIFSRSEPATNVRCWRCGGTTSGDNCGICGSPLTNKGLEVLKKTPAIEIQKDVTQRLAVYSPKDKQFKAVELTFDELEVTINKYVKVKEGHNSEAGPVFLVDRPADVNLTFSKLRKDSLMNDRNLKMIIRNEQVNPGIKDIVLRFFYWEPEATKDRYKFKNIALNLALLVATIVTVAIAGWQYAKNIYDSYFFQGRPALDVFLFTFSLIAILGTHELGHYSISRMKKLDASLPYFIPVPPIPGFQTLGTFGALIRQKEPFATRDDLFDIGIAGPVAGFLVTIPVFLVGLKMTYVVDINPDLLDYDPTQIPTVFFMNFMIIIGQWLRIVPYFDPTMQTIAMHPMMFAGYVGLLITGLNLMPASQLDGGHTARAVFGGTAHRIVSLVISLLLVVNPFTRIFGFLVLVMSFMQHPGSIDDVSKVHWSKYVYISIGYVIGFLCLPLPIELLKQMFQTWFG